MRLIDWVSPEGQEKTGQKIKDTFKERLEGRKIAISLGPLLLLYWFPPWRLGPSLHGAPNHSLITESFSFVGILKKKKDRTHIVGISFYNIVLRLCISIYVLAGLLLLLFQGEANTVMVGLVTFGLLGIIVWGIIKKKSEDEMNKSVRMILEFDDGE